MTVFRDIHHLLPAPSVSAATTNHEKSIIQTSCSKLTSESAADGSCSRIANSDTNQTAPLRQRTITLKTGYGIIGLTHAHTHTHTQYAMALHLMQQRDRGHTGEQQGDV